MPTDTLLALQFGASRYTLTETRSTFSLRCTGLAKIIDKLLAQAQMTSGYC